MHKVIMMVHHGESYRVEGIGGSLGIALDDALDTSVGIGYGPSSELSYGMVYDALEEHGQASRGWATYLHEEHIEGEE